MATLRKEVSLPVPAAQAWAAVRDFGNVHRLVPGFVTGCVLDGDARIVTFGNGMTARERLVSLEDASQRLVWSVTGTALTHHNGAMQVFADDGGSTVVWTADILPDAAAPTVGGMMEQSLRAMRATFAAGGPGN